MKQTLHTAAAILLAALLAIPAAQAAPRVVEIDRVVAIVDDNVITLQELNARTEAIVDRLRAEGAQLPPDDVLRRQLLERLVIERLQLDLAKQTGIQVDDEAVNRTISRLAAENRMTLDQFRQALEDEGTSFAGFREQIRNEMVLGRLRAREVDNKVSVSQREVDQFLERQKSREAETAEYRLSHILIALPEAPTPAQVQAARSEAEEVVREARSGADFRQLAIRRSDGQQALEGGDLGWRRGDQLPTLFADAVADMQVGEVRGPIRSASGYHIIRLAEQRGGERHVIQQSLARHILIRTDALNADEAVRARLERLRNRILAGEPFADLARTHSEDPGSAAKGGDLGWAAPGTFVPAFERTLADLKPGEVSEPFRTEFGWHIVQLVGRRDHDDTDAYLRSRANQVLRQRKAEEALQTWLRRLRDEAYVELRLEG